MTKLCYNEVCIPMEDHGNESFKINELIQIIVLNFVPQANLQKYQAQLSHTTLETVGWVKRSGPNAKLPNLPINLSSDRRVRLRLDADLRKTIINS